MNYYPFHLGDYAAHTSHLSLMEDLAYRRMLDLYYRTEAPLPNDVTEIARLIRMRECVEAVEAVLNEFFALAEAGWSSSRCDTEIAKMQDKQAKARASAAISAARRSSASERSTSAERSLNVRSTEAELPTPTPTPNTSIEEAKASSRRLDDLPACPNDEIVSLYHEALPELPAVRLMSDKRKTALRSFWRWVMTSKKSDGSPRAQNPSEAKEWIRAYFERASANDFLMGRRSGANHPGWKADLDFLLTERGRTHVIERTAA